MSFDASRFTFDPWKNYQGVIMQQGRAQLDSDWNEGIAQSSRVFQTASLDTLGQAVVPMQTPNAFNIGSDLSIGPGRIYVDGLLVENQGLSSSQGGTQVWDPLLAELASDRTVYTPFTEQPYLPGAITPSPNVTTIPVTYLAYLDAWQRELTYVQKPDLVDKAIGYDTTGRYQTIWQVKMLEVEPEFVDQYGSNVSLSNYGYYDQNWTPSTPTALGYTVTGTELLESGSTTVDGSYLVVNSGIFNPAQSTYTIEADFKMDVTGALFGLVFRATASSDAAYIFQWNGVAYPSPCWQIEKQKLPTGNFDYVSTSTVSPYVTGTWVHLRVVVGPGNLFNAYITPSGSTEQQIFTNVGDPFSSPVPYATGGVGLRSYNMYGNTLHIQNFQVTVPVGLNGLYPEWTLLNLPSSAQLTTSLPAQNTTSMENQLYRVEIHQGGSPLGSTLLPTTATFKWSRDNGSAATRVLEVESVDSQNVVISVEGVLRDDIQIFSEGDWVELTNDDLELSGLSGEMHQIATGGVDRDDLTITLVTGLNGTIYTPGPTTGLNTRLRRWDQQGKVYLEDGKTVWCDLDSPSSNGLIPVPPANVKLILENNILGNFSLSSSGNGVFNSFDYWSFASRAADNSIEMLNGASPRGIYHHYGILAQVQYLAGGVVQVTDQRNLWSPSNPSFVVVTADQHNSGQFTIQDGINQVQGAGGGTVCMGPGTFNMAAALTINVSYPLILTGNGDATILAATVGNASQQVINVTSDAEGLILRNFQIVSPTAGTSSFIYYSITTGVSVSNVLMSGITVNSGSGALSLSGSNITVEQLNVTGAGNFTPAVAMAAQNVEMTDIIVQTAPSLAFQVYTCSYVSVRNLTVVNSTGYNNVFFCLDSNNVTLENFTVLNSVSTALNFDSTSFVKIRNVNAVTPSVFFITKSVDVVIENIHGTMNSFDSIGGYLYLSSRISVEGLHFQSSAPSTIATGLDINVTNDVHVKGLRVQTTGTSVPVNTCKGICLEGLDIDTQNQAVQIGACAGVTVQDSTFRSSTGNPALTVVGSTGVTLRRTDIAANGQAAVVTTSSDVNLEDLEIVCVGVATNAFGTNGQQQSVVVLGPQCVNARVLNSSIVLRNTNPGTTPPYDIFAILLAGWLAGVEIRGNKIQSDVTGIASSGQYLGTAYLATVGLIIEDNQFICLAQGISLVGNSFHAGLTRIANNTVFGGANGGVIATGAAFLGSAVEIVSNQITVGATPSATTPSILAGMDARIEGNQITGATVPSPNYLFAQGIVLGCGLDPVIAHASVTDNRITSVNGEAVLVQTPLTMGLISRNLIDQTLGGIVFRDEGSAASVIVEDNSISNIETSFDYEPPAAIGVFNAISSRIVGNEINNVECEGALQPTKQWGAGILSVASNEQHISGNGVQGVNGPAVSSLSSLAVMGPFDRVDIENNEVRVNNSPISNTTTGIGLINYQALSVLSNPSPALGGFNLDTSSWTSNASIVNYNQLAVDNINGIVYAATNGCIQKFSLSTGAYLGALIPYTISGSIVTPVTLADANSLFLDSSGNIYVGCRITSVGANNVYKLNASGLILAQIDDFVANGIYVDSSQNIYASSDASTSVYYFAFSGGAYLAGVVVSLSGYTMGQPCGLYLSGSTLYVADSLNSKVVSYTGSGTTFTGGTVLPVTVFNPQQLVVDDSGDLYIASANNSSVVIVPSSGPVLSFSFPSVGIDLGVGIDISGNVYLSGSNGHVTKLEKVLYPIDVAWTNNATITPPPTIDNYYGLFTDVTAGIVYATAGTSIQRFNLSTGSPMTPFVPYTMPGGVMTPVSFTAANVIFKDPSGNFYIGENGESMVTPTIYKTDSTGLVLTTIPNFVADGIYVDASQNIYASRDTEGTVNYFAFSGGTYPASPGTALTLTVTPAIGQASGVYMSGGKLYVADALSGRVISFVGSGTSFGSGTLVDSSSVNSAQIVIDSSGTLYIASAGDSSVVIVPASGPILNLNYPSVGNDFGVGVDSAGNVYLSGSHGHVTKLDNPFGYIIDSVWTSNAEIINYHGIAVESPDGINGIVYAACGPAIQRFDLATGVYLGAQMICTVVGSTVTIVPAYNIQSVFFAADGNLYAGEQGGGSQPPVVYKIVPATGQILSQIGSGAFVPNQLYVDLDGDVYATNNSSAGSVYLCQFSGGSYTVGPLILPTLTPTALGIATGIYKVGTTIYVADSTNDRIVTYTPNSSGSYAGGTGFVLQSTLLNNPQQITLDGTGNVYVANTANHNFLVLTANGSTLTSPTITVGSLTASVFGVGVDGSGNVYLGAINSFNIIKVNPVFTQPAVLYLSQDTWIFNISAASLVLTANGNGLSVTTLPAGRVETVRVIGNQLEGQTFRSAIQIATTGDCQLTNNYCALPVSVLTAGTYTKASVVTLLAGAVVASDNRVRGGTGFSVNILNPGSSSLVSGNVTDRGVFVNNSFTPPLWSLLNITG